GFLGLEAKVESAHRLTVQHHRSRKRLRLADEDSHRNDPAAVDVGPAGVPAGRKRDRQEGHRQKRPPHPSRPGHARSPCPPRSATPPRGVIPARAEKSQAVSGFFESRPPSGFALTIQYTRFNLVLPTSDSGDTWPRMPDGPIRPRGSSTFPRG